MRSFFWSVFSYIRTDYRKIRTKKTPYLDTFHVVEGFEKHPLEEIIISNFFICDVNLSGVILICSETLGESFLQ